MGVPDPQTDPQFYAGVPMRRFMAFLIDFAIIVVLLERVLLAFRMRDALLAVAIPFIEIHLSNIFAREEFRHNSYFSDIAAGCIFGLGARGYELGLDAALHQLDNK